MDFLRNHIEALVFCSPTPIKLKELKICLSEMFDSEIPEKDIKKAISELKEKYDEIKNTYRCSICYDNNKNIIIEPCMHFCCCNSCSYMIDKCPICRGEIGQFLRIF